MVDSVSVRFKNARVEKVPLNIRIQWNAGTASVSECVLKTQKRPFVHNSVFAIFGGFVRILAECSQFCLRSFK